MKKVIMMLAAVFFTLCVWAESLQVPTVAVLPFEARTRAGALNADGKSITELLGIALLEKGCAELVERAELDKALNELQLSAIGLTDKSSQLKLGKLVGAKIIITGSMFKSGENIYLAAKIIGTETSRVMGCSVSGTDDFAGMTSELASKIAAVLEQQSGKLLPQAQNVKSVFDLLRSSVKGNQRKVFVSIKEDIAVSVPDPAAETELKKLLLLLGFNIVDLADSADFVIRGEALASQAGNYQKFSSASARVELSIFNGRKKLLATGEAKETLAGAAYAISAKDAISQAALVLASELFGELK